MVAPAGTRAKKKNPPKNTMTILLVLPQAQASLLVPVAPKRNQAAALPRRKPAEPRRVRLRRALRKLPRANRLPRRLLPKRLLKKPRQRKLWPRKRLEASNLPLKKAGT